MSNTKLIISGKQVIKNVRLETLIGSFIVRVKFNPFCTIFLTTVFSESGRIH